MQSSSPAPLGMPTLVVVDQPGNLPFLQNDFAPETDFADYSTPVPNHNPNSQPPLNPEEIAFRQFLHRGLSRKTASPAMQERIKSLVQKQLRDL